jgi:hypothetical protein
MNRPYKQEIWDLLNYSYHFRVLKIWGDRLGWGPGAGAERAGSIGRASSWLRGQELVSAGGGGGYLPRPLYGEISAL